jgi:hypothetical protein
MKMSKEHYEQLRQRVEPFACKIQEHIAYVKNAGNYKNLERRILFDVFHAAKMYQLYSYQEFDYNDSHIQTAMRAIFKELQINCE